jgi:hypothetical protein
MTKRILGLGSLLATIGFAAAANAGPVSDTLYYTTFNSGGQDVWKVTGSYTGNGTSGSGTFALTGDTNITSTPGSDGLVFNPNNGMLLVGGQGNAIYQVNPTTGAFTSAAPGMNVFELAVDPNKNVVWGGGSEGGDNRISSTPINPFGGAGTSKAVTGSVTSITHLTFVPGMALGTAYYTSAGDAGTSPHFGTINLATGVTTDILSSGNTPAGSLWHGMEYDPFSGDLILAGGDEILQIDPLTNTIVSSLHLGLGQDFDQGSVDGQGHVFWADNNGHMLFIDYSTTDLIGSASNFVSDTFFKSSLDDIAPLTGAGGSKQQVPEPSPLLLIGAGLLGLTFFRRKLRAS